MSIKTMKTDIWEKRPATAYRKCYTSLANTA